MRQDCLGEEITQSYQTIRKGALKRLAALNKKLERQLLTSEYAAIIEEQKETGVVERAEESCAGVLQRQRQRKVFLCKLNLSCSNIQFN